MVARMAAALMWTLTAYSIRMLGLPLALVSRGLEQSWRRGIFKLWGKVALRIIGMRVEVHGTPPTPPFFHVSNHVSYLDTILVAGQLGCVLVAKAEMERWPLFGTISRHLNTIFINRVKMKDTVRVNQEINHVLDRGEGLHIFVESTTSQGLDVRPFKPALLEPAAQRRFPVHYAAITYRTPEGFPVAADVVCWWTKVSLFRHALTLCRLPYFYGSITFGGEPIVAEDRKALAAQLRHAVQGIFTPIPQGPHTMEKALKEGLPNYPFAR